MTFFVLIVFIAIMFIIIRSFSANRNRSQTRTGGSVRQSGTSAKPPVPVYEDTPLPELLGSQPDLPLAAAAARLEEAFPGEFAEMLKARVRSKYPRMTEPEYNWKLLELKRYFLMTAVLKDVPMFSEAVDDIWHEMLMFTREYNRFGEQFIGSTIHHAPHTGGQADPGGRAWFDWVYAHLFVPTPYSARIWGTFFRHPLNPDFIEQLQESGEAELADRLFNQSAGTRYPEIHETITLLIRSAKDQAVNAVPGAVYHAERPAAQSASYMPYLAGALMVYSVAEFSNFDSLMAQHYEEEEQRRTLQASSGTPSGCSSSSWGDDGSGGSSTDGGSSNGGSSDGGSSDGGSSSSCSSGGGGGGD
jgi:hypothetical protein